MIDAIDRRQLHAYLRRLYIFAGVDRGELETIGEFSMLSYLGAGQRLFSRHEPCRAIFQVVGGIVKLSRRVARPGEQVLGIAAPGRLLGLTGLFTGSSYPFDATAMNDTELVVMQARPLLAFFEARPARLLRVCTELARRNEMLVLHVDQVVGRSAAERVALCLLRATDGEESMGGACALFGDVRQADIANMLGITPETFSRVLARFRREGWIGDDDGVPRVVDRDALASLLGDAGIEPPAARARGEAVVRAAAV